MTTAERDTADALFLWHHLFDGLSGYLCAFAARRSEPGAKKLDPPIERFFAYPIAAENAAAWLLEQDARGLEAYFCAHLLTDRRRVKENAAEIQALWADGDGALIPDGFPRPTAIVESSPGRHHYYWRLTRPIPPAQAETLNRRIAYTIGADTSGWDLGQLLRVPGTSNRKYSSSPPVQCAVIPEGGAL